MTGLRHKQAGVMCVRISTAALSVLTVAFWASGASAAAPLILAPKFGPATTVSLDRTGHVVNLNLGGALPTSFAQDALSIRPNVGGASDGIQLDLTRGRNWDAYADLFPSSGSLNSAYLSGTTTSATVTFALGRDVNLQIGQASLGLGALNGTQPSDFARDLAARLGPDLRNIGTTSASLNWRSHPVGGHRNQRFSIHRHATVECRGFAQRTARRQHSLGHFGSRRLWRGLGYDACLFRRRDATRLEP